jgi:predicted protein tyrosine phosphatase
MQLFVHFSVFCRQVTVKSVGATEHDLHSVKTRSIIRGEPHATADSPTILRAEYVEWDQILFWMEMQITAKLQLVSFRRHHQANLIFLTLLHKSPLYSNFPINFYKLLYKCFPSSHV